jgi:glycerate kinase
MPLKILIIPDKFKGTLTAQAAAQAIARGWRKARPQDKVDLLPMSDGGDGFGEVFSRLLHARPQTVKTVDAAHRAIRTRWWWEPKSKTAIIESTRIIGLAMLPPGKFHPFDLDTFGLGAALRAAAKRGARHCLIGIGGSATNDGGFGMACALDWQFLDLNGTTLERWTELGSLDRIVPPGSSLVKKMKIIVAVDVQNRLLGPRGASRVYGPQKGLRPEDFPLAERCLSRLARVVKKQFNKDFASVPGAGAAGGLGFGLFAFTGARAESGVELFVRYAQLTKRLRGVDLVITGEGAIDKSTLMGKGVGETARRCRNLEIPCIGLAGVLNDQLLLKRQFTEVHCLTPEMTTPDKAKARAAFWLEELTAKVGKSYG